ncbi:hypothetical protein JL101_013340 [Skermanella rosea]|uniref:hypothetical protein n=1 Tax=Skermanella rosea TaxID=1817965 RepID=UPI0019346670|nr:hypothetical protein [Skermanella rosea]UEM06369.1 hypothetical protein JL101_013340 [Skermanella rosea]
MTRSDSFADLDVTEQLSRLRRQMEETDKYRAETRRLIEESDKCRAEQRKLIADLQKLDRDRRLDPVIIASTIVGVISGLVVAVVNLLTRYLP